MKVKGQKKIFYATGNQKKARVAIIISSLKTKTITKDKEKKYIMIKGSIQQEDIIFVTIYSPNIGAPKYIKQILKK